MNETTFVQQKLEANSLKEAIEELKDVVDRMEERLKIVETIVVPKNLKGDLEDVDGSIADVQKRLKALEENQRAILGIDDGK